MAEPSTGVDYTAVLAPAIPQAPKAPELPPEPPAGPEQVTYRRSETIGALAAALATAQGAMLGATKDSTNPHFKSRFASLASVWAACREALSSNGLAIFQSPSCSGRRVTVVTLLMHASGEWIESSLTMLAAQDTPQGIGSTITYARRYALAGVGVAPDDDDGEEASRTLPQGIRQDAGKNSELQKQAAQTQPAQPVSSGGGAVASAVGEVRPTPPVQPAAPPPPKPPVAQARPPAPSVPPPPPGMKPPARAPGS